MEINYFELIRSINELMIAKQLGAKAYSLFRVLLDKANTFKFPETLTLFNSELLDLSGLTKDELYPARDKLIKLQINSQNILQYENKGTHKPGLYWINYKGLLLYFIGDCSEKPTKPPTKNPSNPPTKVKNVPQQTDPAVSNLIRYYHSKFVDKFGEKPTIDGGKDGRLLKGLLRTYGEEKLKGLIDRFFDSDDSFITNSSYTMGVFKTVINKLLINKDPKEIQKPKALSSLERWQNKSEREGNK